jgi:preprotein translocase SecE subunit
MRQLPQFLYEVKLELSRVEWPNFQEFVGSAFVTLIVVVVFALFLGIVDKFISILAKYIFTYSS